jgi:dipeptidyl-peptidase-3
MNNLILDKFYDVKILSYECELFNELTKEKKILIYCLSQAALCGRDILWDQNFKYNIEIRRLLEKIYLKLNDVNSKVDKPFVDYFKRVLFSNGIHHHYSTEKFIPEFNRDYLLSKIDDLSDDDILKITDKGITFIKEELVDILFNQTIYSKRVSQNTEGDLVADSSNNFYSGVSMQEAELFYRNLREESDTKKSVGLNSQLKSENGIVCEEVWSLNGMYGKAIEQIVFWLNKALSYTENSEQAEWLKLLVDYYTDGDLDTFDNYSIAWLNDKKSVVDSVNGFIEIYGDPLGIKASWEAIVNIKNTEATRRTEIISENAQWFEDNSPVNKSFKKDKVKGVSAKVIDVVTLGGDCYPATPIGINLPNAEWIREEYGSKSVTIENITKAYHKESLNNGFLKEFAFSEYEIELNEKYGFIAGNMHTDLHECLGHGSGKINDGITTEMLKNYYSPIEEARADLFALYYIYDQKMIDLGLFNSIDAAKCEYSNYIRNGLVTQLGRIELGKDIEQAHMRNRQLISKWCYEKGLSDNIIERKVRDNKTFFVINDYEKLRDLFAELLKEIQRIKSEGDYEAAKLLVENYGIKIDYDLHREVLERFKALNIAPYSGFVNPKLIPVIENNIVVDIMIEPCTSYIDQMLEYSENYSFL